MRISSNVAAAVVDEEAASAPPSVASLLPLEASAAPSLLTLPLLLLPILATSLPLNRASSLGSTNTTTGECPGRASDHPFKSARQIDSVAQTERPSKSGSEKTLKARGLERMSAAVEAAEAASPRPRRSPPEEAPPSLGPAHPAA